MTPKLRQRVIGAVNILEIEGLLTEPGLGSLREEMQNLLHEKELTGLLMNLREVEKVDRRGAETVIELLRRMKKSGILGRNMTTSFVAETMQPGREFPIFQRGKEAVTYFEKEFAASRGANPVERRRFPRIKTALPAELEITSIGGTLNLDAVVTNLSEGGLYGYFIDSQTEQLARRSLDPFDLKLLRIEMRMPSRESAWMEGKVVRLSEEAEGVMGFAVEFYEVAADDKGKICEFLKQGQEEGVK